MLRTLLVLTFIMVYFPNAIARIACVRGYVRDPNGAPVNRADLDFDDAITGERLYTPGDNTDINGFYTVCVPNGIYNISYGPPPLTHLLGYQRFNDTLYADVQIDVTLDFGVVISGKVTDSVTGDSIGLVDLDADDLHTGRRIYTPNDNSDTVSGDYWIVVPPGDYRVRFQPPIGTRWLGLQLDSVGVYADTVINASLSQGVLLSGNITDNSGMGLPDISVDLRETANGAKVYLAYNITDSTGYYNFAVPTGMFTIRYDPPLGSRYVGVAVDSVNITGDLSRDQVLESGWLISAFVHDSSGNALAHANFDIIQESTGKKLYTPHDKTDSLGNTIFSLLPDTYTFRVQPPPGSIFDRLVISGVTISADTSMDFTLAEVPKVNVTGRVLNQSGTGIADIAVDFSDTLAGSRIFVADNTTDTSGNYDMLVPIGGFNVEYSPPRGSRYAGYDIGTVIIEQDTVWDDIVLNDGVIISGQVYDPQGNPVEGVDFDFIRESTGEMVFTPHDNSDAGGSVDITVVPDIYTISLEPSSGSGLQRQLLTGFNALSDTSLTFFLNSSTGGPPVSFILKKNSPNPFNGQTSISYVLFVTTEATIYIYNTLGQRVKVLNQGRQVPGFYLASWDGTDNRGKSVASGVYYYRLATSKGSDTRKMLLVR